MIVRGREEPLSWQEANEESAVRRPARRLNREAPGEVRACCEAGPLGYALQRELEAQGMICEVVASCLIPIKREQHRRGGGALHGPAGPPLGLLKAEMGLALLECLLDRPAPYIPRQDLNRCHGEAGGVEGLHRTAPSERLDRHHPQPVAAEPEVHNRP